jgi:ubiquinone/menaquinone biosynthesis C-methylase UbiE
MAGNGMGSGEEIGIVKQIYDRTYYEKLNRLNFIGNNALRERQRLHAIERLCQPGPVDDVLELGCGSGQYTRQLAGRVRTVTGVDFSGTAIEKARSLGMQNNMQYTVADICSLRLFPDQRFDKIIAIDVLEHLSDVDLARALSEVRRLLKVQGVFVFFTPCRSHWLERLKHKGILRQVIGHIGVRTEREYGDILHRQGLRIRDVIRYETCIPLWRLIEGKMKDMSFTGGVFVSRLGVSVSH